MYDLSTEYPTEPIQTLSCKRMGEPNRRDTKKDGSLLFHVDCRKINDETVSHSNLPPQKEVDISKLEETHIFASLEANSSYWKAELDKIDR